jgi:hypothetical protein
VPVFGVLLTAAAFASIVLQEKSWCVQLACPMHSHPPPPCVCILVEPSWIGQDNLVKLHRHA